MNKQEYLIELRQRLNPLPLSMDDINEALQYYEEYFAEAGPEHEQEAIKELGSPAYVAAQIGLKLTGSLSPATERATDKVPPRKEQKGMAKMVLLGVLAAPVALPLVIAAAATIFALMVSALAFVLAFGASGVAICVTSVPAVVFAFSQLFTDFATGIYWLGGGLVLFGVGAFMLRFGLWVGRLCIKGVTFIGRRVINRGKKPEVVRNMETASPVEFRTEATAHAQEN